MVTTSVDAPLHMGGHAIKDARIEGGSATGLAQVAAQVLRLAKAAPEPFHFRLDHPKLQLVQGVVFYLPVARRDSSAHPPALPTHALCRGSGG